MSFVLAAPNFATVIQDAGRARTRMAALVVDHGGPAIIEQDGTKLTVFCADGTRVACRKAGA